MSSGTYIIERALEEIGARSVGNEADPEEISNGKNKLNSMLASWKDFGIELPTTPLKSPGSELNEPSGTTNAIIFNLAIELAGAYSSGGFPVVSLVLQNNAIISFRRVKQLYRTTRVPNKILSSTTPRGQGNIRQNNDRLYFDQDEPISG